MLLLSGSPTKHSNELMIKSSPTISLAFPSDRVDNKSGNSLGNATSNGEKIGWILTLVCFNFSAAYLLLLLLLLYCSTALLLHYSTAPLLLYCSTAPLLVLLLQSTGRDAAGAGEEASQVSAPHGFIPEPHQHAFKPDSQNSFISVQPCALIPEASYHTKLSFIPVHKMISNQMFFQYLVKKVRQDRETPGQFLLVSHWLGNILSQHCQRSTTILEQVLFLLCFSIIQPFSSFLILHNNGHSQASLGVNVETAASPFSSFIPFS